MLATGTSIAALKDAHSHVEVLLEAKSSLSICNRSSETDSYSSCVKLFFTTRADTDIIDGLIHLIAMVSLLSIRKMKHTSSNSKCAHTRYADHKWLTGIRFERRSLQLAHCCRRAVVTGCVGAAHTRRLQRKSKLQQIL